MDSWSVDCLLSIFWLTLGLGTLALQYLTVSVQSSLIPGFAKNLLLFGKFGHESRMINDQHGFEASYERHYFSSLFTILTKLVKSLEVPKSWFLHFYIYLLLSVAWIGVILLFDSDTHWTRYNFTLWVFLFIQAIRRTYECSYVSIYSDNTINIVHYLTGFFFYTSVCYASLKTFLVEPTRASESSEVYLKATNFIKTISVWLCFVTASFFQYHSHVILAQLRQENNTSNKVDSKKDDGENSEPEIHRDDGDIRKRNSRNTCSNKLKKASNNSYYLPTQGLFKLIVCPHYLCEIVIFTCILLVTEMSLLWLSLYLFVIINQIVAALLSYRWYQVKFGKRLPSNVKAIIPFLL